MPANAWTDAVTAWSTLAGTVGVYGSLVVAVALYFQSRHLVARKEALEFIRRQLSDEDIIKMFRALSVLLEHKRGEDLRDLSVAGKEDESRRTVIEALNYYEMLAIGIRVKAIDAATYRHWWRTGTVQHFIELQHFIEAERRRKSSPDAWAEFHALAIGWAKDHELGAIVIQHPADQFLLRRFRRKRNGWLFR